MRRTVSYFEKAGPENTQQCLDIVRATVKELNYKHIVVASTTGGTGKMFAEAFAKEKVKLVVVTHSFGFAGPNKIEMSEAARKEIEALGAAVYTGTMITHSLETALSAKFSGVYPSLLVAQSLRRFGEGPKVCCEMVMMAADAGLIPEGEEVIAVAGTGRGADTVMIIRAVPSKRFLDLRVLEILAKARG
ncbi:MAG TPA: hypothetical protein ENG95_02335 [Nitrospirae bacterium]|nr:pyruvate kinase, alpha/beta domain [bacterium BMS3Abin10]GBE39436.1 pyruvate kinase, alpha/beta domain [bacterium BMS3Bbin08]HDH50738.1 hypothetical protein [Nitrospirota bacterium]HDK16804.1 hypothetical protein [Nitrospirota bacterium]HDK81719.1 hypothetical protein [Nitrospirota bacterium]